MEPTADTRNCYPRHFGGWVSAAPWDSYVEIQAGVPTLDEEVVMAEGTAVLELVLVLASVLRRVSSSTFLERGRKRFYRMGAS